MAGTVLVLGNIPDNCEAPEFRVMPEELFYELIMSLERKGAKQIDSSFLHLPVGEDFLSPLHSVRTLQLSRNAQTDITLPPERESCHESLPVL